MCMGGGGGGQTYQPPPQREHPPEANKETGKVLGEWADYNSKQRRLALGSKDKKRDDFGKVT